MPEVTAHAEALRAAVQVGGPWLDPAAVELAQQIIDRSLERLRLGAGHTVVALVGATGSGKSSLFNALASMDIAQVGARRPLTTLPMASVWGEDGSQQLLDWLEVPAERRVRRESVLDADRQAALNGLVLLDLPDHDSTEVVHRVEVDRLVTMVDLLIWVVDPQKYADDALHSRYLRRMTGHDAVMVVVLNQIDRLTPEEADVCRRDLRRLLDGDGLESVRIVPVSATRGDGVDDLRELLAQVVQSSSVIEERLDADLIAAGDELARGLAPAEPGNGEPVGMDRLVQELAAAAGVPSVLEAISAEYRRRGLRRTGWPVLRGLSRISPDALSRLGGTLADRDLRVIASSLLPVAASSQRAQVELAVQTAIAANADPLPRRWAQAVREGVAGPATAETLAAEIVSPTPAAGTRHGLVSTLDGAVASVDLQLGRPLWWRLAALAQFVFAVAAAIGAVWLFVIGASQLVGRQFPSPPSVAGMGLPLLLLILGLVAGALLAVVAAWALRVGASRRQETARTELYGAVRVVADERVGEPVRAVLVQHRATRVALAGEGVRPVAVEAGPEGGEVTEDAGVPEVTAVDEVTAMVEVTAVAEVPEAGVDVVVDLREADGVAAASGAAASGAAADAQATVKDAGSGTGPESGSHALTA
jgi:GTP-binding protein EngB required for normal cell division